MTNYASDVQAALTDEFSLEGVEPGSRARQLVLLGHDGLGWERRLPVMIIRGMRPGPIFGLTCALHGNELNGIPVVHRLFRELDPRTLRGTVVACPAVNIPGFLDHEREFDDGQDLNHLMPGVEDGNEAQIFAHRLVDRIVSRFEVLIDLHTASFGRVNSLYVRADMSNRTTARMAYLQRPQIILHNPPSDHTLRGAAADLGIPSITIEVGDPQVFQPKHIRPTLHGVRAVMSHFRMLPKRALAEGQPPIVCSSSRWFYTDQGGLLNVHPKIATQVESGDLVATQTDIFGDTVREYLSPLSGVVIGKSVNPVSSTGARILHLGDTAHAGELVSREEAASTPHEES